ncbi:MAG: hypothetical protein FWB76_04100, partial [Oscillospiraceae bacterium]|nr:hypothetical protein [Oscillospiraceae bacterium]
MKRLFSAMLAILMLAAFAVGALGLRVAVNNVVQSGSWQLAEVRWFGIPYWEIDELQGHALVEHTSQDDWAGHQILTLR